MPLNIRLAAGIYHRGRHIIYIQLSPYIYMFVKILCTYVSRISCVYMFIDYILYNVSAFWGFAATGYSLRGASATLHFVILSCSFKPHASVRLVIIWTCVAFWRSSDWSIFRPKLVHEFWWDLTWGSRGGYWNYAGLRERDVFSTGVVTVMAFKLTTFAWAQSSNEVWNWIDQLPIRHSSCCIILAYHILVSIERS